ncbi:MAG: DUF393 domain-containing protein [Bacteroidia bacterium]|nr:DUF393 domain-containing protein [Bacteroidia bacterium]NNJ55724.1 DUF393 domain-containing protein [Bacteroidia bacterium]
MLENEIIVFFDGYCNLCNRSVDFIIRKEKRDILKFASLQSSIADKLININEFETIGDSIVVYNEGKVLAYSDAALFVSRFLNWPYNLIQYSRFIPKAFRDKAYKFIAKNRYNWFGKKETCRLITDKEKGKFLG